jgi:hypothetical protein
MLIVMAKLDPLTSNVLGLTSGIVVGLLMSALGASSLERVRRGQRILWSRALPEVLLGSIFIAVLYISLRYLDWTPNNFAVVGFLAAITAGPIILQLAIQGKLTVRDDDSQDKKHTDIE